MCMSAFECFSQGCWHDTAMLTSLHGPAHGVKAEYATSAGQGQGATAERMGNSQRDVHIL